ncbi:uncharacterized protein LOC126847200 [Adelges cooleyi]|uniref:uncharacterized protein LOC126847200 n=1 Tax=Adelges cooleyi TaxID=133065 RepID=UPI002180787E|nr:uncharacterized protein LOC126847200 [Adelges cooleyi]
MKLLCVLFTFVLVSVSANDDATYKKIVFLTNAAIEQAFNKNDLVVGNNNRANGLEHIIEKIVNDDRSYRSFAQINFMIASPDKLDLTNLISAFARFIPPTVSAIRYQLSMRKEIKETLDIDISDDLYREDPEGLNLTTLAEQRRRSVKKALKNIFRSKFGPKYNRFMTELKLVERNTLCKCKIRYNYENYEESI